MNLIQFHLGTLANRLRKEICECNRIIENTNVRGIIKIEKNKRRNKAKFIIKLEEAINILKASSGSVEIECDRSHDSLVRFNGYYFCPYCGQSMR